MPDPADTLMILVEASVAIAGFSGVIVAFGRHADGEWSHIERGRLVLLLTTSFSVLFLSLTALVLLHAGTDSATTWRISSATWSIIATYETVRVVRQALRVSGDDPELPNVAWLVTILSLTFVIILLSLANALAMGQFWPFLAALVWLFGLACYVFARLLLVMGRGNQDG